jgi:peptidoglycan hydrolase-like protein with peptidoglycan-binding domain
LVWSDAEAIKQKMELAKELGVRGVAIFKIDDGQDPELWNVLEQYKNVQVTVGEGSTVTPPITTPPSTTPTPGSVTIPTVNLQLGARNASVKDLQKFLNQKGFVVATMGGGSVGNETTYFGPATRAALIKYQKARSITPAVGYCGPLTRATMQKEV